MHDIELYDLYDVWYRPWWLSTPTKIVWALSACILICGLVWLLMRWIRAQKSIPYAQRIINQCAQLKKNSDTLELPLVYAHLTGLVKEYLERRYDLTLKSLTDDELMAHVHNLQLSDLQKANIQEILTYAVPAKFDVHQDNLADPIIHIALLEQLIKETRVENNPSGSSV